MPELQQSALLNKLNSFKSAVETGKGHVEQEHSNRHSRYQRFAQLVCQQEDILDKDVATTCFQHRERRALLAKSKVWSTGDFEAIRVLGQGSFGTVYLARKKHSKDLRVFTVTIHSQSGNLRVHTTNMAGNLMEECILPMNTSIFDFEGYVLRKLDLDWSQAIFLSENGCVVNKGDRLTDHSLIAMKSDANSEKFVAVKQMKKSAYARKNHRERIFAERDILADARSRWIVNLYQTFHDADHAYMVMEFLQGGDLIGHLLQRRRFSLIETSFYMAELIEALDTVHRSGFVHRDVKPDNVVLTTEGHLKLLDFGLCRQDQQALLDEDESPSEYNISGVDFHLNRRAQLKSMVGTPQYIAPEVYQGVGYGPEADLWSLGIITYECLVGTVPFHGGQHRGRSAIQVIRKKVDDHERVLRSQLAKAKTRGYVEEVSEDFLLRIICAREQRLDAAQCRDHPLFTGIDFTRLHEAQPPIVPAVTSPDDAKHFDDFDFQPLASTTPGAKDASMEWLHYDFDSNKKDLHRADVDMDVFLPARKSRLWYQEATQSQHQAELQAQGLGSTMASGMFHSCFEECIFERECCDELPQGYSSTQQVHGNMLQNCQLLEEQSQWEEQQHQSLPLALQPCALQSRALQLR